VHWALPLVQRSIEFLGLSPAIGCRLCDFGLRYATAKGFRWLLDNIVMTTIFLDR